VTYEKMEEARRAEDELHESKLMLESLFEGAPDAIAAADSDGRIVRVNAQTESLFGYTRDELLGQPVEILVPERFRGRRAMFEGPDLYGRRKDGSEFPADIMLRPLETRQGTLVLSVVRDLTARKADQERIRSLDRELKERVQQLQAANHDLDAFNYSVSHDLRAPLRAIAGFAGILMQDHEPRLDSEGKRLLQVIVGSVGKMGALIDGMLALSFLGRAEMNKTEVNMAELARQVVEEAKGLDPGRLVNVTIQPLPPCQGDRVMLRQVFANLASNAWKFTRDQSSPVIEIGSRRNSAEIVYYVNDNGAGFDMRRAGRLFGLFQRLHSVKEFPGTGIGLALVQRIVHRHGGRVWAESVAGQGATFYFTLSGSEVQRG
jgi:PAS domain S-box-containing protein